MLYVMNFINGEAIIGECKVDDTKKEIQIADPLLVVKKAYNNNVSIGVMNYTNLAEKNVVTFCASHVFSFYIPTEEMKEMYLKHLSDKKKRESLIVKA